MKVTVLEFNKMSSIDEFSDLVQKILNENNDLLKFRPYENPYNGNVKVELSFGSSKTIKSEIMTFGPAMVPVLVEQLNATLEIADHQTKQVKFAGFIASSKSPRSLGFLVLSKGTDVEGKTPSAEIKQDQERTEDTTPNDRTARRRKNSK